MQHLRVISGLYANKGGGLVGGAPLQNVFAQHERQRMEETSQDHQACRGGGQTSVGGRHQNGETFLAAGTSLAGETLFSMFEYNNSTDIVYLRVTRCEAFA